MRADHARDQVRLFVLSALLALTLTQIGVSGFAWFSMREALRPELDRKARVVASAMAERAERAVDLGVPLDRLEGLDEYFARVLARNPDIAWIGLEIAGTTRASAGLRPETGGVGGIEARSPVAGANDVFVAAVGDPGFIGDRLRDLALDLAAVMLVSLFIAFEFVRYALDAALTGPLEVARRLMEAVAGGRFDREGEETAGPAGPLMNALNTRIRQLNRAVHTAADGTERVMRDRARRLLARFRFADTGIPGILVRSRLPDTRLLTFLFMFAENLARPFLPVYVTSFLGPGSAIPPDVAAGMPIAAFMLVVALGMPWAGGLSERIGRRRGFLSGAFLSVVGLTGSGLAFSLYDLMAWRVVDGLGYAVMFMSAQGFAVDCTPRERRAEGMAVFVGGIMAAEICAPALGGIVADRLGDRNTLLAAGALTLLTLAVAVAALREGERPKREEETSGDMIAMAATLARNPRFLVLTLCAGFPAKMTLIGFLYFLVPVFAADLGGSRSDVGRVAMLYGAPTLLLMPVFARIADRWSLHGAMVGAGGLIAGLGLLPILFKTDMGGILIGVAALGIGQSMSITPQITLAARLAETEIARYGHGPVLGIYRLMERCGSAGGPFIYGVLASTLGYADAMAVGGAVMACGSLIFSVVFLVAGVESEREEDADQDATDAFTARAQAESAL